MTEKENQIKSSESVLVVCSICDRRVQTHIDFEISYIPLLLITFVLFLLFGLLSLLIYPVLIPLTKTIIHRCPRCYTVLGEAAPIISWKMNDQVATIQCGECALVVSRKYVIAVFLIFLLILAQFVYFFQSVQLNVKPAQLQLIKSQHQVIENLQWIDYIKESQRQIKSLRANSKEILSIEKVSLYIGTVMKVKYHRYLFSGISQADVYLKMEPQDVLEKPQVIHLVKPDVLLIFGTNSLIQNIIQLQSLQQYDRVSFNGTLISIKDSMYPHQVKGDYIKKIGTNYDPSLPVDGFLSQIQSLLTPMTEANQQIFVKVSYTQSNYGQIQQNETVKYQERIMQNEQRDIKLQSEDQTEQMGKIKENESQESQVTQEGLYNQTEKEQQ